MLFMLFIRKWLTIFGPPCIYNFGYLLHIVKLFHKYKYPLCMVKMRLCRMLYIYGSSLALLELWRKVFVKSIQALVVFK